MKTLAQYRPRSEKWERADFVGEPQDVTDLRIFLGGASKQAKVARRVIADLVRCGKGPITVVSVRGGLHVSAGGSHYGFVPSDI